MLGFRDFITEVVETKREGIQHLEKMKDVDFIDFVQQLDQELDGKISNIPVSLKVDGLGARWGRDERGKPFFEGSRTGPIYQSGAFSDYARSKGGDIEMITRAEHYDSMLEIFKNARFMEAIPEDTKMIGEILYNPLGEMQDDGGIAFVKTSYDKNKLGNMMTIVPLDVIVASSGEEHPQKQEIMQNFMKYDSNKIKIADPSLEMQGELDVNAVIDPIKTLDDESKRILQSRKKADKEEKQNLRQLINKTKEELANYLIKNDKIVGSDKLGTEKEGLVFQLGGQTVKVTSPEFRAKMAK